jgi:hypothetical protein
MKSKLTIWTGFSLAAALAGSGLAGCTNADTNSNKASEESPTTVKAGEGDEHGIGALPLPNRLAFMAGHVEAGLALYRAGEPKSAAPHLLHPVSETHASEREGLSELGFDASLFEAVSAALDEGRPASEIEGQLKAAEANLREVQAQAGGDPAEILRFLMETATAEYAIAVTEGAITDPAEYQDAWGFVVVAKRVAARLEEPGSSRTAEALGAMLSAWPEGAPTGAPSGAPSGDAKPASADEVAQLAAKVLLTLPSE